MSETDLDPLLHQPVRTRLTAYIAARGEATFNELKQVLDATDGNLEGHVKKLVAAGYLTAIRAQGKGRPQTLYRLTDEGNRAFHGYVAALQHLLPDLTESEVVPSQKSESLEWQPH